MPNFNTEQRPLFGLSPAVRVRLQGLFHIAIAPATAPDAPDNEIAFFYPNPGETETIVGVDLWDQLYLDALPGDATFRIYVRDIFGLIRKQFPVEITRRNCRKASFRMPGDYLNLATDVLLAKFKFDQQGTVLVLQKDPLKTKEGCLDIGAPGALVATGS